MRGDRSILSTSPMSTQESQKNLALALIWIDSSQIVNNICITFKDENISNHGYIGDISVDILKKNIDKPKIDQNL